MEKKVVKIETGECKWFIPVIPNDDEMRFMSRVTKQGMLSNIDKWEAFCPKRKEGSE